MAQPFVEAPSTPRMRGSTRGRYQGSRKRFVYPAHAGIDPATSLKNDALKCLPRACGDRPLRGWYLVGVDKSTPRMRGSTLMQNGCYGKYGVYPAHAGIDLLSAP